MANATFEDVITQLQFNNRSEAGRDGRHTMALKAIAGAIVFMGGKINESNQTTKETKDETEKNNKKNNTFLMDVAKQFKITDVANNITGPITGFLKSLPGAIPGGDLAMKGIKKGASAFEVEKKREDEKAQKKQYSILEALYNATVNGFSSLLKGLGKAAGIGLGALLAPLFTVGGFFAQMITELGFIASKISQLARFIGRQILKIPGMEKVKNLATSFISFISNYLSKFKKFFIAAPDAKEVSVIQRIVRGISKTITFFVDIFKGIGKVINFVFKPVIQGFKSGLGMVTRFATTFGRLLGRIFIPISILISIFDSITGFIEGFKESEGESMLAKVIDGIGGGLGKLIGNLVGIPLDLLTRLVGWILGKFGFENAQSFLNDFVKDGGFTKMIRSFYETIFGKIAEGVDFIIKLFTENKVGDTIKQLFGDSVDFMSDFLKKILRVILPKPNPDGNWWDAENLVSKAIPDAVYNYAGLDPKTGAVLETEEPSSIMSTEMVEQLSGSRQANQQGDMVITTNNIDQSNNSGFNFMKQDGNIDQDYQAGLAANNQ